MAIETPEEPVKPVGQISFWQERIYRTFATGGMLHQVIFDDQYDLWNYIQSEYAGLLRRYILPGQRVLDAGCGYGALVSCFEEAKLAVEYVGVDFSPDLIRLANYRYPKEKFLVADLCWELPFPDKHFDWAVVRSVHGMICKNLGEAKWTEMRKQISRVSKNIFLGGYAESVGGSIVIEVE